MTTSVIWVDLNGQGHEQALPLLESNEFPTHECLPLAVHHKHCRGCHHRKQCPAIGGLVQAKLRQQHELLRHSQSEATKSLKTA